jgi:hypothetical protein
MVLRNSAGSVRKVEERCATVGSGVMVLMRSDTKGQGGLRIYPTAQSHDLTLFRRTKGQMECQLCLYLEIRSDLSRDWLRTTCCGLRGISYTAIATINSTSAHLLFASVTQHSLDTLYAPSYAIDRLDEALKMYDHLSIRNTGLNTPYGGPPVGSTSSWKALCISLQLHQGNLCAPKL